MKASSAVAFACLLVASSAFAQQVPAHANPPGFKDVGTLPKVARHTVDPARFGDPKPQAKTSNTDDDGTNLIMMSGANGG